jgi:hypothetical protein
MTDRIGTALFIGATTRYQRGYIDGFTVGCRLMIEAPAKGNGLTQP